jgi:hypothetical protein
MSLRIAGSVDPGLKPFDYNWEKFLRLPLRILVSATMAQC